MSWRWATFWSGWIIFIAVSFAIAEGYALATGGTTLSRYVWTVTAAFPPIPFIAGFLAGFLACHFWWGGIVSFSSVGGRK